MTTQRRTQITARHLAVFAVAVGVALGCAEQPGQGEPVRDADEVMTMEEALSIGLPLCAGPSALECPAGQYCRAFTPGRCPGPKVFGVCARRPDVCPQIFDPVCGCDGQTYPNACVAASKGVAVAARGACPVRCQDNGQCAATAYCRKAPGQCGAGGACAPRPQACTLIYQPVCGCDGKTYGNACQAAGAGVNVASEGECPKPPATCTSNEQCGPGAFCERKPGHCGAPGVCSPRPQVCPRIFQPVCGCDRKTYGNRCEAASAGVSVALEGECGPFCGGIAGFPCPGAGRCVDDPTDDCDPNNGGADCGGLCVCKADATCAPGSHFDPNPKVCACVPDDGPVCGAVTCPAGQVCCNASCGICTPPGGACIQIACEK